MGKKEHRVHKLPKRAWDVCIACGEAYWRQNSHIVYCSRTCHLDDHYSQYDEVIQEWRELYEAGASLAKIAGAYKVAIKPVRSALLYAGVKLRPSKRHAKKQLRS